MSPACTFTHLFMLLPLYMPDQTLRTHRYQSRTNRSNLNRSNIFTALLEAVVTKRPPPELLGSPLLPCFSLQVVRPARKVGHLVCPRAGQAVAAAMMARQMAMLMPASASTSPAHRSTAHDRRCSSTRDAVAHPCRPSRAAHHGRPHRSSRPYAPVTARPGRRDRRRCSSRTRHRRRLSRCAADKSYRADPWLKSALPDQKQVKQ